MLERGFRLHAASHFRVRPLPPAAVAALAGRLGRARRPVELIARRA